MKRMMLIDGSSLLFRAFYATYVEGGRIMKSSDGTPTNAIYSLTNIIFRLISDYQPDYALCAFDTAQPTVRHDAFEGYKATRKPAPVELVPQFALSRELFKDFGIVTYENAGIEADDIIGTMAKLGSKAGMEVMIISGDRDLLQLIDENITVYLTKKGVSELLKMDEKQLMETYQIRPDQVPDLKGLMGDASDNIPGIKGIGEKTAVKLLKEFDKLESVLEGEIKGAIGQKVKDGKESAIFSKKLATILSDLELPFGIESIEYAGAFKERLKQFFTKLDMKSHLAKVDRFCQVSQSTCKNEENSEDNQSKPLDPVDLIPVFDQQVEVVSQLSSVLDRSPFTMIVEQLGKNYLSSPIIGLAIQQNQSVYFISFEDFKKDLEFHALLADETIQKYAFDQKQTINALKVHHIEVKGFAFDFSLATYLLEPSLSDDERAPFTYHQVNLPFPEVSLIKNLKDQQIITYSGAKAYYIGQLRASILARLQKEDLYSLYSDIEVPLSFVLAKMEQEGIGFDVEMMKQMEKEAQIRIDRLTSEIYHHAGHEFNINSPAQLGDVLFDELGLRSGKKRSTAVDVLEQLRTSHPIIEPILEYRKMSKLQSTYIIGLQNAVHPDGKIHTIFNQTLAQTGRLSSKEPNLQNITIRDESQSIIRKAFIPEKKENYFLSVDYSQIELRVLAHLANATSLIEAFNNEIDIHQQTAMKVFGVTDPQLVSKEQRRQAKAVNFGIIYGISDWGLADQLGIDVPSAREFINRYYATYPEIKSYLDGRIEDCMKNGYVTTMFHRKREVKEIHASNYNLREFGKRIAMNTPIQGSAADIIKKAMIDVDKMLTEHHYRTKMILQIHDELLFEVPYDELMKVLPKITKTMEECVKLKVRLKVEYGYGHDWYQAK